MALELLQTGSLYHVFNHAVGKDNLFLSDDNYSYFLRRHMFFIEPLAETYAYCLMPNHIHFLVEVKPNISLPAGSKYEVPLYISKQFSNLFSSYTQGFNKQRDRRGTLFMSRFRRELVHSDEYLTRLIRYIHLNPVKHRFVNEVSSWKYSSYNVLSSNAETFLAREKVISWFGNLEEFKKAHDPLDRLDLPE